MKNQTPTVGVRAALLQALATELANMAADTIESSTGASIGNDVRDKLAADVYLALCDNLPLLANAQHALDMIPPAA